MATLVLAMVVSVWRWYRPGGPMTLDQVRELYTGRLPEGRRFLTAT